MRTIKEWLNSLLLSENQGDTLDAVFGLCDTIGIPRPVEDFEHGGYRFEGGVSDGE